MSKTFAELFNAVTETPEPEPKNELALPEPQDGTIATVERNERQLAEAESRLYEKSVTMLDASASTFELTDQELSAPEPPERWVREAGSRLKAWERFNIARNARLSKRDAPIALDLARQVHTTMVRARAAEKKNANPFNAVVAIMQINAPPEYEEREVIEVREDHEWDV